MPRPLSVIEMELSAWMVTWIRAVAGQRFVDGVVQHFEHQMVQAGAVRGVADVHAGALAHGFQAFQDLDGGGAVFFRFGLDRGVLWILGHGLLSQITIADFGADPSVWPQCCGLA
jgi:hypothetical protein